MKSLTLTLPLLAMLGVATGCFVACGADTSNGTANGGTSGSAGKSSTSGAAGSGASGGGSGNSAGTASEPSSGSGGSAGAAGALASGGAGGVGGASASGGAAEAGAGGGGAAGAGGAAFTDRCGGCNYQAPQPQICIYQAGGPGPGRFVCATQNPCGAQGACACIVGQGECSPAPQDGTSPSYCVCDNGLQ
jgi:hypothetical protein